jgi:hypothetical protein
MIAAVALIGSLPRRRGSPCVRLRPAGPSPFFAAHRERFLSKLPAGSIAVIHATGLALREHMASHYDTIAVPGPVQAGK